LRHLDERIAGSCRGARDLFNFTPRRTSREFGLSGTACGNNNSSNESAAEKGADIICRVARVASSTMVKGWRPARMEFHRGTGVR